MFNEPEERIINCYSVNTQVIFKKRDNRSLSDKHYVFLINSNDVKTFFVQSVSMICYITYTYITLYFYHNMVSLGNEIWHPRCSDEAALEAKQLKEVQVSSAPEPPVRTASHNTEWNARYQQNGLPDEKPTRVMVC